MNQAGVRRAGSTRLSNERFQGVVDCVVLTSGVAALSGLFFGTMLEEDAGVKEGR
jgi:hypothetical protein